MGRRLLITGAGTGASNNLIRSLRAADPSLFLVGCHDDRFVLKKSPADRNYLLPPVSHPGFPAGLRRVIDAEQIDLLVPDSDPDVKAVSDLRARIPCRLLLPRPDVIDLCQDKHALAAFLRGRGLPAPLSYPVTDLAGIGSLFRRLAPRTPLWCRIRRGGGTIGALPVRTPGQARSWIAYWEEFRGIPATEFTLSEYLPGREYGVQGLWHEGQVVLLKMVEVLAYFGGESHPSGVSSTPALAKVVCEPRVVDVCARVLHALDARASGMFSIDLKEDADGVPCVMEINAGRFCMITSIYDLTGKHSMAAAYLRLAFGEPVEAVADQDVAEDYYLIRDLDTLPGIFHADELFDGIHDARETARQRGSKGEAR